MRPDHDSLPALRRIALEGDQDLALTPALERKLAKALDGVAAYIVIDLTEAGVVSARVLGALVRAAHAAAERGGTLRINGASPFLCDVLRTLAIDELLLGKTAALAARVAATRGPRPSDRSRRLRATGTDSHEGG